MDMASHTAVADLYGGDLGRTGGLPRTSRFMRGDGHNNISASPGTPRKYHGYHHNHHRHHHDSRRAWSPGTPIADGPGPATSSPGGGGEHACCREVEQAVLFLAQLVRPVMPDNLVDRFMHALDRALTARFEAHWYPDEPERGSGFRSLSVVGAAGSTGAQRVDPILLQAWAATLTSCPSQMLPWSVAARQELGAALRRLDTTFTVWIDPGEVTVRMGEEGSTWPLWQQHFDGQPCQRQLPGHHKHQYGHRQQHSHDQHRVPYQIPDPTTDSDSEREGGFSGACSSTSESSLDAGQLEELDMMPTSAARIDSGRLSPTAAAFTPKVSAPIEIDALSVADKHPRHQPDDNASKAWDGGSGSSADSMVEAAVYITGGAEATPVDELPRRQAGRSKSGSEKRPNKYQRRRRGSRKKGAATASGGGAIPGTVAA